jgi:hypothetical protein
MISLDWAEQLTKALPRRAEYWPGDVIERASTDRYEVVDIAYSPQSDTFLYEIESLPEDSYRHEWIVDDDLVADIVEKADRPEPLSVDTPFDPENIDEIDKKLRAFERAQQRAAEENNSDSDVDDQ